MLSHEHVAAPQTKSSRRIVENVSALDRGEEREGIEIEMYSDAQVQISVYADWCAPGSFQCASDRGLA